MSLFSRFSRLLLVVGIGLVFAVPVKADTNGYCLCSSNVRDITPENYNDPAISSKVTHNSCKPATQAGCTALLQSDARWNKCEWFENDHACKEGIDVWNESLANQKKAAASANSGMESSSEDGFIPSCALKDELTAECKDVGIFILLGIGVARYLFSIVGGLALLVFVYGGFVLILSQGNAEQVQKGRNAMMAAVIGLTVAFSGYFVIKFLGTMVGLADEFKL